MPFSFFYLNFANSKFNHFNLYFFTMKRFITITFLMLFAVQMFADRNYQHIQLDPTKIGHFDQPVPADMPEVYYNTDTEEIIIVADGFSAYYDVDIISQSSMIAVISTQVDGYGDSIDISSLPDDNYTIVITSEFNNVYQGQFTNY